jgi:hypothetical protein
MLFLIQVMGACAQDDDRCGGQFFGIELNCRLVDYHFYNKGIWMIHLEIKNKDFYHLEGVNETKYL